MARVYTPEQATSLGLPGRKSMEIASRALGTEGVTLQFQADGIRRLAEIAWQVNERVENIGARRLYTVMEKLLEELSFTAPKQSGETVVVDAAYVDARLKELAGSEDLARYVL